MKITILNGSMPSYDNNISKVLKIVKDTLMELDVEVSEINLAYSQIPYFDGVISNAAEEVMNSINQSDGLIFATTSSLYGISALMLTSLEYLNLEIYKDLLRNKNCMILVASFIGDERHVLEQFARIINGFGGYDTIRVGLSGSDLYNIEQDAVKDILEKQLEDFYRMVRQNRKFFIPSVQVSKAPPKNLNSDNGIVVRNLQKEQTEILKDVEHRQRMHISDVYDKLNLHSFTERQQKDINEISELFSQMHNNSTETHKAIPVVALKQPPAFSQQNVLPRSKTCKQMTLSLPHYFQPQFASGINTVVQINVAGAEQFNCYMYINNAECDCKEGIVDNPEITINAETNVWLDILKGKYSAQKAFMIGQLKVRGNFVVLTKFEQLFKPI